MSLRICVVVAAAAFLLCAGATSTQSDPVAKPSELVDPVTIPDDVLPLLSKSDVPQLSVLDVPPPLEPLKPMDVALPPLVPVLPEDNLGLNPVLPVDGDAYSLAAPGTGLSAIAVAPETGLPPAAPGAELPAVEIAPMTGLPEAALVTAVEADSSNKLKAFILGQSASNSAAAPTAMNVIEIAKANATFAVEAALNETGVDGIVVHSSCEEKHQRKMITGILLLIFLSPMVERFYLGYHAGPIFALILWMVFFGFFTLGTGCVSHVFGYLSVKDKEKMKMRLTAAGATMVVLFVLFVVCFLLWGLVDFALLLSRRMHDGNGCALA